MKTKENKYTYINDKLVNEYGQSVMMGWERPIMKRVSEILTQTKGDVLNIGFGMGIVDTYISERNPKSHTIIECHPDVINHIKETGWETRANMIYSRWQEQIGKMDTFDYIYLDTWSDTITGEINDLLQNHLRVGGLFLIWYYEPIFNIIKENLPKNYEISYEYIINDNLIPPSEEQFKNGGSYIDPNSDRIIIPIIKRLS